MLALHGTGVSSGISLGTAHVIRRSRLEIPQYSVPVALIETEVERFQAAVSQARSQLETVRDHIPGDAPSETGSFIDTHLLILSDKLISTAPIDTIRKQKRNAEWALRDRKSVV